ncbi:MAG: class I SAM-dependent methyltransferase [Thiohalomonadaceae bacterium]
MGNQLEQTQALLAKHHRDGERFARIIKEGFERRFNEEFWDFWNEWIAPVCTDGGAVLDLGAGPGLFVRALAQRFPQLRTVGVECAPYMLEAVEPLPENASMLCEDLHDPHLPLADASVDAALASVVLHEMNQPVRSLLELRRCMRPGGRLLILDWVRAPLDVYVRHQTDEARVFGADMPVGELEDLFTHFIEHNRFSREDLVYLLNRTGFAVIDTHLSKEGRYARIVAERR